MRYIDLFAGIGGFIEGAHSAGAHVVWAANHWPLTAQYHQTNHLDTWHECQDLQQTDWCTVPMHDVMLASPACQGHSRARGREWLHHDALRSTAWAVVAYAEYHRNSVILVEDMPDFEKWVFYPAWHSTLRQLGCAISPRLVNAADHGTSQNRQRLFLVCTRPWRLLRPSLLHREHQSTAGMIQWDAHPWNPIAMLRHSEEMLRQIAAGRAVHGSCFLVLYYSSGSGLTGHSIHRPVDTTTTHDHWAVIEGDRMRMLTVPETRDAMSFPPSYILPNVHRDAMYLLGNAVYPMVVIDFLNELRLVA